MGKLIGYELKKLLGKRALLAAILLFSLLNLVKIGSVYRENSYLSDSSGGLKSWSNIYWQLYGDFSGEITSQRIEKLLELFQPVEAQVAELTASTRLDRPDTMTGNIYSDYHLLRRYFVLPMERFYSYGEKAGRAAEVAAENARFYQERGNQYEARKNALLYHQLSGRKIGGFEYTEMYQYFLPYDFSSVLLLLLCLYALAGMFSMENDSGMEGILLASPYGGRATAAAKISAASIFLAAVSLWFSCLDFVGFSVFFHTLEGGALPVYAISNFAASPLRMTLGQYSLISALVRALGAWCMGMIFLFLAELGKNALISFLSGLLACAGLVVTGTLLADTGNPWLKVCNPYTLLQNRILFGKAEFLNVLGFPVPSYAAAVLAICILGGILVLLICMLSPRNTLRQKTRGGYASGKPNLSL